MDHLVKFAKLYLIILFFFAWGYLSATLEFFPFGILDEPIWKFADFAAYEDAADTNLAEKILNDLGLSDARHQAREAGLAAVEGREYRGVPLPGGNSSELSVFSTGAVAPGYFFVQGSFDLDDSMHGVVLIDHEGELIRTWNISQEGAGLEVRDTNTYPHGLAGLQDGSLIVGFDEGNMGVKYGACGQRQYTIPGNLHHALSLLDQEHAWGLLYPGRFIVQFDTSSGEMLQRIKHHDIRKANPEIDIFGVYEGINAVRVETAKVLGGHLHINDAEPLTADLAAYFPGFETGDLLVSYRNPNLIFVLDPDTLKVKWWRQGLVRKQHDPDWTVIDGKGYITVFDNNSHRGPSRIQIIDPVNYSASILADGADFGFHSETRGKHQVIAGRFLLITATNQGRAIIVDLQSGEVVWDLLNRKKPRKRRVISEVLFLPADYFDEGVDFSCRD
jgi:hypothetical protein